MNLQSSESVALAQPDPDGKAPMRQLIARWAERGWLRWLDSAFADFLLRECPDADPLLILAAALTSHQLGRGHAGLDLAATLADPAFALSLPPEGATLGDPQDQLRSPGDVLAAVSLEQWLAALANRSLVAAGPGDTPLVLIGSRLYLRRYWQYEQDVRRAIDQRLELSAAIGRALPVDELRQTLAALFPPSSLAGQATNWQKLACAIAARTAFCIITGGPGTGKTTTVVRVLALLQALALAEESAAGEPGKSLRALRIRLAAPTGKAAARLNESIANAVAHLPLAAIAQGEAVRASIPTGVTTLHRLLGSRPGSRHFRHHAGNLLAIDVLVIDEASMVDLEMMAAVLAALPGSARLILLGDKDQLASVEAGAVLGQLCQRAGEGHYTEDSCDWLATVTGQAIGAQLIDPAGTPLDQAVVMLRHSHRFSAESGIGRLAEAVNSGSGAAVREIWTQDCADLKLLRVMAGDDPIFRSLVIDGGVGDQSGDEPAARRGYGHYLETIRRSQPAPDDDAQAFDDWARTVLKAHSSFQLLCALRQGPWGVDGLNQRIARLLLKAGLIEQGEGWYLGRPVLVTRNDYGLGVMNGDIGITLARPAADGQRWSLRVAFPAADGSIKWVLPIRLQAVETVYALTVHKSQGSEFSHVAMVLPETLNPILTRELIYTGITRAREALTVVHSGSPRVLEQAIARRVLRRSGLAADGADGP
jgi:exodeoxyribonuclease V alpha subunit